jgi:hypothetical protein
MATTGDDTTAHDDTETTARVRDSNWSDTETQFLLATFEEQPTFKGVITGIIKNPKARTKIWVNVSTSMRERGYSPPSL